MVGWGFFTERTRGIEVSNLFKEKFINKPRFTEFNKRVHRRCVFYKRNAYRIFGITSKELPNLDTLISFNFILLQQNLCAKPAWLSDSLKGVISIVNYN